MISDRKVLLARPHPFNVAEMKPMLVSAGFLPSPLSEMRDITDGAWRGAKGAVISVAVSSAMAESAEAVFNALRACAPGLPIVFAGLNEIGVARGTIQRLAKSLVPDATVIGVEKGSELDRGLGKAHVFLYIQKDVLKTAEGVALTTRILQRHFA